MKANEVFDAMRLAYKRRDQIVPLFLGDPGIGKTEGIQQFADSIGVNLVTFILSNTTPSEVSGIRMPDKDTKALEVFDDSRMSSLKDGDILFFDEILEAQPALWSACLTLIQSRVMASGRKLPDVMICAASNLTRPIKTIAPSVRDRFMIFEVQFSFAAWRDWFTKKYRVEPPEDFDRRITRSIKEDNNLTGNLLTPRRIEKMFLWVKEDPEAAVFVEEMFGSVVAGYIKDMVEMTTCVHGAESKSEAVMAAITAAVMSKEELDSDVLEELQKCKNPTEAIKLLKKFDLYDIVVSMIEEADEAVKVFQEEVHL